MPNTTITTSPPALLTRREAARYLRVSLDGLDRFLRDPVDPLPGLRAGRRWLFRPADLEKWAERAGKRARPRHR